MSVDEGEHAERDNVIEDDLLVFVQNLESLRDGCLPIDDVRVQQIMAQSGRQGGWRSGGRPPDCGAG